MSDIWLGAEDDDFQLGSPPGVLIGFTFFPYRTAYARCALYGPGANAYSKSVAFTPQTSCWLSCQIQLDTSNSGDRLFGLMNSGTGSSGLYIGCGTPYQRLALYKWDGAVSTLLASETGTSFIFGSVLKLDIQLISYGAAATVNIWLQGVLVISFTGDVRVAGVASLDTVVIASAPGGNAYVSEVIVSQDDTRTRSLFTKALSGPGDADLWTGSVSDVNEVVLNDGTTVYTNTAGQDEQFVGAALPAGAFTVTSVMATARCSATAGSTATTVAVGTRSESITSPGTPVGQTTTWAMNESLLLTNPATGLAFTGAEINALQISLRSGS